MELKETLDREEGMVRDLLKKHDNIITHILIEKTINGRDILIPIFISANREQIKLTIEALAKEKPNYLIFVTEAYMKMSKDMKEAEKYTHGKLEEEFKNGDKGIQDVIILQAYSKNGKLMRMLEKKTLKQIEEDVDEFNGYLAVSDVQRVFFDEKVEV
jgi:high-affinity Fe2+/Pb2+ permease